MHFNMLLGVFQGDVHIADILCSRLCTSVNTILNVVHIPPSQGAPWASLRNIDDEQ